MVGCLICFLFVLSLFVFWSSESVRIFPIINEDVIESFIPSNLYEEGKVCLSILGTWAGDRNEIWSAARSSLLQAFISIQGLVLVKEPCVPGSSPKTRVVLTGT